MIKQRINSLITNQNCGMSVQVSLTGLSFLVSSLEEGEPIYFLEKKLDSSHHPEELLFELTKTIDNTEELQGKFNEITLVYQTNNYTLVPSSLFSENKSSEYLKFNTKILSNDFISHDEIENQDMVNVYVPFVNINNYIFEKYGSFKYYHGVSLLLKNILLKEKHSIKTKVFLHINDDQFECIVVKNGKTQLCNSFNYKTPEDFIYYVLFVFEQLKINPDTMETILLGNVDQDSAVYKILYTYVRNITFFEHSLPQISEELSHKNYLLKTTL